MGIGELVEKSEVFKDVDAETDDDSSMATTHDSKEDTLTELSDMAEDTTLIKSTEISIVEDMCVKEEIMTDVTESDTLDAPSSLVNCIEATEATFVETTNQESIQQAEEAEVKHTGFILKKHTVISNQYTAKMPKFEEKLRQLSFTAAHGDQLAENAVEIQLKLAQLKLTEIVSASYSEHDTLKLITSCEKADDAIVPSIKFTVTDSSIAIQSDDVCSF